MKSKTILAAFLAASTLVSLAFTSCGDEKPKEENEENGEEIVEEVKEKDFAIELTDELASKIKGEEFNILVGSVGQKLYAESENSDLINDEVYRRNTLLEEHYGITLNVELTGAASTGAGQQEATSKFRALIDADDDTYQAFTHVQHTGMPQMILEGKFIDWKTIPYINLDADYWYKNIEDDLCFGNKIYCMTGDYALYVSTIDCLLFNKQLFDELGIDYPYEQVKDGTWTWDVFAELVKQGSKDLNGDGLIDMDNDRMGFVGWAYEIAPALVISQGVRPLEKDADNMPILMQNVDETHNIYEKIVDLFRDGQHAAIEFNEFGRWLGCFTSGRALFADRFLGDVTSMRDVEFDFGIIPYPKANEDAEYMSRSSNMTAITYIPVTNRKLELTGIMLEELAFQSGKKDGLSDIYFETVLTVKNTRDNESADMLPIIRDSARFLYEGYLPSITSMIGNRTNTFASTYAANLTSYQTSLEEMKAQLMAD